MAGNSIRVRVGRLEDIVHIQPGALRQYYVAHVRAYGGAGVAVVTIDTAELARIIFRRWPRRPRIGRRHGR
jgi:hypothetical protein